METLPLNDYLPLLNAWLMIGLRTAAFLVVLPGLDGLAWPRMARMGLTVMVATLLAGVVPHNENMPTQALAYVWTGCGEVGLGLLLGFVSRFAFYAIEVAGRIIAMEIGLTATPGVDSPVSSNEPLVAFMYRFAVLLFFISGAHLFAIHAFARSFFFCPAGRPMLSPDFADSLLVLSTRVIAGGLQVAAPFIAMNFLLTVAFGLLGRAAPRINVYFISFTVRSLAGLAMLGASGVLVARYLLQEFAEFPERMLRMLPPLS